jgi:hypothetical protein
MPSSVPLDDERSAAKAEIVAKQNKKGKKRNLKERKGKCQVPFRSGRGCDGHLRLELQIQTTAFKAQVDRRMDSEKKKMVAKRIGKSKMGFAIKNHGRDLRFVGFAAVDQSSEAEVEEQRTRPTCSGGKSE